MFMYMYSRELAFYSRVWLIKNAFRHKDHNHSHNKLHFSGPQFQLPSYICTNKAGGTSALSFLDIRPFYDGAIATNGCVYDVGICTTATGACSCVSLPVGGGRANNSDRHKQPR